MATVDDTAIAIADEYAKAALELAQEQGVADEFLSELADFVAYLESDGEFRRFLQSPVVDADARGELLERTLRSRMSDLLLNTILVMNGKGRAELIPLFYERCRLALEHERDEVDVFVTTAHPLSPELRGRLTEVVRSRAGRKPVLIEQVDPDTLAGLKVQIEDELLDLTAENHLRRLRRALLERASHELHTAREAFVQD